MTGITYYSTNEKAPHVPFRQALLNGLAPDGGLYMPSFLPVFTADELKSMKGRSYADLASFVLGKIIGHEIPDDDLRTICSSVYDFDILLENVYADNYLMRLDRGPTASFKDFAALLMGRLMQYFLKINDEHITILTATSGDTGSAVANAFSGLENIKVIILYPRGEVTEMQRKQMTTFGGNIRIIEIDGKFDDCQRLVKMAFTDETLSVLSLSSANSINIGRLLPQSVYYFKAWSDLANDLNESLIFSVPCGNFGNVAGGIIAMRMGLPVKKFVIATNENDEVPYYLETGKYEPVVPSINCISSAMNVGHPSNLARIVAMYGGVMDEKGNFSKPPDMQKMKNDLFAVSVSDEETKLTIRQFHKDFGKILEPHGAVAWHGLQKYLQAKNNIDKKVINVSVETAHPAKFIDEIRELIDIDVKLPESMMGIVYKKEDYISLDNDYSSLRDFIIKNY